MQPRSAARAKRSARCSAQADFLLRPLRHCTISYGVVLILGIIGSTPLPKLAVERIRKTSGGSALINAVEPIVLIALLAVSTAFLIDGSFNPFLYFRF